MSDFQCVIWKVEHGSAAFLRTPNDRTIMFDAGCSDDFSPAVYLNQTYGLNSYNKRLDRLILSHPDRDHIRDIPNVHNLLDPRRFTRNHSIPEKVIYPSGTTELQEPLKTYKSMIERYRYEIGDYNKHLPVSNWGNVLVETFCCEPRHIPNCPESKLKNNLSLVSYVGYLDTEIVFPGDLEPYGWKSLLENTNIRDYVGRAECRILVASHHGRKSGIRYKVDGKEYIYTDFLELMQPNLVIISDKWGNETTDPEAYRPHCTWYPVISRNTNQIQSKEILTTKTNEFILITVSSSRGDTTPVVKVP